VTGVLPVAIFLQPISANRFTGSPFWFVGQRIGAHSVRSCERRFPFLQSDKSSAILSVADLAKRVSSASRFAGVALRFPFLCYMIILLIFSFP